MQPWASEDGSLWALEPGAGLPGLCAARMPVAFAELDAAAAGELAGAAGAPDPAPLRRRLEGGRRCFVLRAGGQIVAYGWATRGPECVGELERWFNLCDDEAYIWDCATTPAWRGQRLYSALLSQMAHRLAAEGVARIWVGASLRNRPSISGIANAGFRPVLDLSYRRLYRLSAMWVRWAPAAPPPTRAAARRLLLQRHERMAGSLAVGYRP